MHVLAQQGMARVIKKCMHSAPLHSPEAGTRPVWRHACTGGRRPTNGCCWGRIWLARHEPSRPASRAAGGGASFACLPARAFDSGPPVIRQCRQDTSAPGLPPPHCNQGGCRLSPLLHSHMVQAPAPHIPTKGLHAKTRGAQRMSWGPPTQFAPGVHRGRRQRGRAGFRGWRV